MINDRNAPALNSFAVVKSTSFRSCVAAFLVELAISQNAKNKIEKLEKTKIVHLHLFQRNLPLIFGITLSKNLKCQNLYDRTNESDDRNTYMMMGLMDEKFECL